MANPKNKAKVGRLHNNSGRNLAIEITASVYLTPGNQYLGRNAVLIESRVLEFSRRRDPGKPWNAEMGKTVRQGRPIPFHSWPSCHL